MSNSWHRNDIEGLVLTLIFDSLPELKILKNGCSSLSNENVTMDTKCPIYSFPANTIQIFKLIKNFGAYQSTYNKTNNNSLFNNLFILIQTKIFYSLRSKHRCETVKGLKTAIKAYFCVSSLVLLFFGNFKQNSFLPNVICYFTTQEAVPDRSILNGRGVLLKILPKGAIRKKPTQKSFRGIFKKELFRLKICFDLYRIDAYNL